MPTTRAASTPSRRATRRAAIMRPPGRRSAAGAGGPSGSLLAPAAVPHDLVRVPDRLEAMLPADLVLQRLDPRRRELDHGAAPETDHVLVVPAHQRVLVERGLVLQVEAGLAHQAAVDQVLEGAVDRGARDADPPAAQARLEELRVEMLLDGEDFARDGAPLGRVLEALALEVDPEAGHRVEVLRGDHVRSSVRVPRPGACPAAGPDPRAL